jgi:hypothetical protein
MGRENRRRRSKEDEEKRSGKVKAMKEKEVGIMVKEKKEGGLGLHLFPSKEAMARWRGEDSEHDVEGRYQEWVLPVEVLEDLWAAAQGEE